MSLAPVGSQGAVVVGSFRSSPGVIGSTNAPVSTRRLIVLGSSHLNASPRTTTAVGAHIIIFILVIRVVVESDRFLYGFVCL